MRKQTIRLTPEKSFSYSAGASGPIQRDLRPTVAATAGCHLGIRTAQKPRFGQTGYESVRDGEAMNDYQPDIGESGTIVACSQGICDSCQRGSGCQYAGERLTLLAHGTSGAASSFDSESKLKGDRPLSWHESNVLFDAEKREHAIAAQPQVRSIPTVSLPSIPPSKPSSEQGMTYNEWRRRQSS